MGLVVMGNGVVEILGTIGDGPLAVDDGSGQVGTVGTGEDGSWAGEDWHMGM